MLKKSFHVSFLVSCYFALEPLQGSIDPSTDSFIINSPGIDIVITLILMNCVKIEELESFKALYNMRENTVAQIVEC